MSAVNVQYVCLCVSVCFVFDICLFFLFFFFNSSSLSCGALVCCTALKRGVIYRREWCGGGGNQGFFSGRICVMSVQVKGASFSSCGCRDNDTSLSASSVVLCLSH